MRATYQIWCHQERLSAAFAAYTEQQKRIGVATATVSAHSDAPAPAEREETIKIWRDGHLVRQEHRSGDWRDGAYGVRHGDVWWSWDSWMGSVTNQGDPRKQGFVGVELAVMLDPSTLLDLADFATAGQSVIAGRATQTAHAIARPQGPNQFLPIVFHRLGTGADRYVLEVDLERGVLMEATAVRNGELFRRITTTEIEFDQPIPAERFVFEPPESRP